jgi:hypothetical protein
MWLLRRRKRASVRLPVVSGGEGHILTVSTLDDVHGTILSLATMSGTFSCQLPTLMIL